MTMFLWELGANQPSTQFSGVLCQIMDTISPSLENDTFLSGGVIRKCVIRGISLNCC